MFSTRPPLPRNAQDDGHGRANRDLDLIRCYRDGELQSLDELLRTYELPVRGILAKLGVHPCDIDDLTQETFFRVFRNLQHFREQSSFYTWLYRITVNVCFDAAKKRKRADVRLGRLQKSHVESAHVRTHQDDPYFVYEAAATRAELRAAVSALPESFQMVVTLREIDDLPYATIAAHTDLSIGTVRSRLSRARSRLKELLRPGMISGAT